MKRDIQLTEPEKRGVALKQCEDVAEIYYRFRKRGNTLNDLVEIPAMKRLIGSVKGKRLLDAGCGYGLYSIFCAQQGASVTGVDISETMIRLAREEATEAHVDIDFRVDDCTDLNGLEASSYDTAISSLAVGFDMPAFFKEMARVLKPGGIFCFSQVHPILGASEKIGEGKQSARRVDGYFNHSVRSVYNAFSKIDPSDEDYEWFWEHYTLQDYFEALREAGFLVETLWEPEPDPEADKHLTHSFDSAYNYPIFFLIRAIKQPKE